MESLSSKYETIKKQINDLETQSEVKKYLEKIEELEEVLSGLKAEAVVEEKNIFIFDGKISIRRRMNVKYDEQKLKEDLPDKYNEYLKFDAKSASADPELNDYAEVKETVYASFIPSKE
jgi:hypothetical protein